MTTHNSPSIHDKLFALYSVTLEKLTEYFKGGSFDEFSIKPNEFQVFGAFWVTTCCLRSVSETHEAIEDFNKAIKLNSEYAVAYNNRGTVYAKIGNNKEAMEDYNQAKLVGDFSCLDYSMWPVDDVCQERGD